MCERQYDGLAQNMIRAVLMDVDDTLLDFKACAQEAMDGAMRETGLIPPSGAFDVFVRMNDALWHEVETGAMTVDDLYRVRWNRILSSLGISFDGALLESVFLRRLRESAVPMAFAREISAYLSGKYILCVATNAPAEQQTERLRRAGLLTYYTHVFSSGEIGAAKPDTAFFTYCAAALGSIPHDEIMVIGDSLSSDIRGGIASGMKTCWFCHDSDTPPTGLPIDMTVHSLREVRKIL